MRTTLTVDGQTVYADDHLVATPGDYLNTVGLRICRSLRAGRTYAAEVLTPRERALFFFEETDVLRTRFYDVQ